MSEWQPIESAPKDGTRIIAYMPKHAGDIEILLWVSDDKGAGWAYWDNGYGEFSPTEGDDPTHWMPCPPLPREVGPVSMTVNDSKPKSEAGGIKPESLTDLENGFYAGTKRPSEELPAERCGTCRFYSLSHDYLFWEDDSVGERDRTSICRRNPPQWVGFYTRKQYESLHPTLKSQSAFMQPVVSAASGWCGEWKPAAEGDA